MIAVIIMLATVLIVVLAIGLGRGDEFDPYEELLLSRLYSKDSEWVMEKTETVEVVAICRFCGSELGAERKCQGCGAPK